ncbi:MAG: hypothetical protein J6U00_14115 [Ruminococcus sp.]|uniref:hypothetical protein n=1 Tax=Ruminococcus sp. TaxID=41978 RepID=UPI001B25D178|nr:hypothetical protein [Ruminococcus sp.]MBO7475108.1 hypothetical protein [Ruminococcus sp.]
MQNRPLIALCLAVLAAVLIIVAGKSCAEDINRINKRTQSTKSTINPDDLLTNSPTPPTLPLTTATAPDPEQYVVVTNMIGEVIQTIPITTEEVTEQQYATVTDLLGDPIGLVPIDPDEMPTTTLSILEQYEATRASMEAAERAEHPTTAEPTTVLRTDFTIVLN